MLRVSVACGRFDPVPDIFPCPTRRGDHVNLCKSGVPPKNVYEWITSKSSSTGFKFEAGRAERAAKVRIGYV